MWHVNQHLRTSTCRAKWTGSIVKGNPRSRLSPPSSDDQAHATFARAAIRTAIRQNHVHAICAPYIPTLNCHSTSTTASRSDLSHAAQRVGSSNGGRRGPHPATALPRGGARISRTQTSLAGECRSQPGPLAKPMAPSKCARLFKQITFTSSRGGCASAPRRARCCRS